MGESQGVPKTVLGLVETGWCILASLTAMDIVEVFEEDIGARRRLAELLVEEPYV